MLNTIRFCRLVLILLTMLAAAAGQNSEQKEEFDQGIVEAVFQYQITKCAENMSLNMFLLSLRGKDPSEEFMKRFENDSARVKPRSVLAGSEATNEFIDKESGKFVALLSINTLKILEDGSAQVEGSCGYADWAARGYRYGLVKNEDRWIVKYADRTWVW